MHTATRFQFLEFTYDVTTGELTSSNETVRLQPQPAAALRVLLQHAGELVTRETLKQAIWPNTVVEADQGLNFCVRQIRIALGEDAEGGRVIETLPRRGYRFVAAVSTATETPSATTATVADAASVARPPSGLRNWRLLTPAALVLIAALVVAASAGDNRSTARPTLAILPLNTTQNNSWAAAQNSDLTEALVAALTNSSVDTFGIVGPSSTARFAATTRPHTEIGTELGVDYVVSGGLRMTDSTMFVQVIRVTDGVHVFAVRQPLKGRNAASLAALIANGIATKVK